MRNGIETTITLRALSGTPLADTAIRRTVQATARAIAERTGVELVSLEISNDRVKATLQASRLAGIGFAAELRRITTNWHQARTGQSHLWGEPTTDDGDDAQRLPGDAPP